MYLSFDMKGSFLYHIDMFVAVVCDPGSEDSRSALYALLPQYGFEKVQRACYETTQIDERRLASLKREIDKVTDYYDVIRIYQYPLEGNFALTTLKNNKWRRIIVRPPKS